MSTYPTFRIAAGGALLCATLLLSGCGTSTNNDAKATAVAATMLSPKIVPNTHGHTPDSFYVPRTIRVKVGQTITWTNMDNDLHDVTEDAGIFASSPLGYRGVFHWTPLKPGRYPYSCTLHPEMHGVVIVER